MKLGGHRGSGISDRPDHPRPSQWQENSKTSIDQAFALGADFVELDWVWDGQGQGWICHSMALEQHFSGNPGFLDQLSTHQVAQLRGFLGEPLLCLEEAMRYYRNRAVNLEIKGLKGCHRERVSFLQQSCPENWPRTWWLSSFDPLDLLEAEDRWPNLQLALLSAEQGATGHQYLDSTPYLTGAQALEVLASHPDWWWHPEITDRPDSERYQIGWSIDGAQENRRSLEGLQGLITDHLDDWLKTG